MMWPWILAFFAWILASFVWKIPPLSMSATRSTRSTRYSLAFYHWKIKLGTVKGLTGTATAIVETDNLIEAAAILERAMAAGSMELLKVKSLKPIGDMGTMILSRQLLTPFDQVVTPSSEVDEPARP